MERLINKIQLLRAVRLPEVYALPILVLCYNWSPAVAIANSTASVTDCSQIMSQLVYH